MKISIYPPQALHELGCRPNQEDSLWPPSGKATQRSRLFIVCDGMGGHDHGEVASAIVAETIGTVITRQLEGGIPFTDELLRDAINEAYNSLDAANPTDDRRKMGTTLTLLALHRHGVTMAHIGDSRIYHLRPATGTILYQSRDHSLVVDLQFSGELSPQEAAHYEGKNVITRAMQPDMERRPKADIAHTTDIEADDWFMLCSDGVMEQLSNNDLMRLFTDNTTTDEEKCRRLTDMTASNDDNHTAYLIHIVDVERNPTDDEEAINDEATSRCNMVVLLRQLQQEATAPQPSSDGWLRRTLHNLFG